MSHRGQDLISQIGVTSSHRHVIFAVQKSEYIYQWREYRYVVVSAQDIAITDAHIHEKRSENENRMILWTFSGKNQFSGGCRKPSPTAIR